MPEDKKGLCSGRFVPWQTSRFFNLGEEAYVLWEMYKRMHFSFLFCARKHKKQQHHSCRRKSVEIEQTNFPVG